MITLACLLGSYKTGRTKDRVMRQRPPTHGASTSCRRRGPAVLSRRQPAGQKGCRHEGKLTKDTSASQQAISTIALGSRCGPFDSSWVLDLNVLNEP